MWRRLGLPPAEAKRLPWYDYRLALEGLAQEFGDEEHEQVGSDADSLRELGFSVNG